jgi:hypothetical protein
MKLSAEQYAELLSSFYSGTTPEQTNNRRAPRMALQARLTIVPLIGDQPQQPIAVTTCDFSARGLAFLNEKPMRRGEQFITELPRRTGGRVRLLCEVVRSEPTGTQEFHRIGANFICNVEPQPIGMDHERELKRIRETMLK